MKGLGAETRVLNTATKPWLDRDPPGNHCPAPFGKAHSESTQKSSWAREQSLTEQVSNDPGSCYDFWVSIWTWASHENVNKPSSERSTTKLSFLTLAVKCNETCRHAPTYPSSDKTARACTDPTQAWISVALHETSETWTFSGIPANPWAGQKHQKINVCLAGFLEEKLCVQAQCTHSCSKELSLQVIPPGLGPGGKKGGPLQKIGFFWHFLCCSGWFWPMDVS